MSDGGMTDDLSALAWVHDEVRRSLEVASKALRRFVRDHEAGSASDIDAVDPAVLRTARAQLHQGVGALELIGQTAAARVLAASEALVGRYVARPHELTAAMVDDLERASFALLDYLSRLLAGKAPSPLSLFPRYRAVLEAAQVERVHPADLWVHDWEWRALPADRSVLPLQPDAGVQKTLEAQLLPLMRALDPKPTAGLLSDVCAGLGAGATTDLSVATLWQLSSAMFEAQAQGLLGFDVFSKRVASRLLAQFRAFARGVHEVPDRLAQDLLFFCAQSAVPAEVSSAPRLHAVREAYGLGAWLPVDYAVTTLGRFDPALIAQAKKRVVAAKDAWSGVAGGELHRLTGLSEQFALVAESLKRLFPHGELFATELQQVVAQTQQSLSAPPAPLAMEVATSLLYVEAALDDIDIDHPEQAERIARLAARLAAVRAGHSPEPLESWMEELYRRVSDRQTMGSVVQELRASLSEAEKQIDAYFRDPARREVLIPVPNTFASMRGVLSVLGMDHATAALLRMRDEVDQLGATEVDPAHPAHAERFERLAGNLGALGFLIDMLSVQPAMAKSLFEFDAESGSLRPVMGRTPDRSSAAAPPIETPLAEAPGVDVGLVEQAQNLAFASVREDVPTAEVARGLDRLSRDAHRSEQTLLATTVDDAREALGRAGESAGDTAAVRGALSEALVDFVASTSQPIGLDLGLGLGLGLDPALPAASAALPPPPSDLALDDEMREVFLEEAREVLAEAATAAASLRTAPDDLGLLTTLRRSYHTLKGSSRMVGLNAFGDGAWVGEQLYNTQLAGQGAAPPALLDFTAWSIDYLGAWVDAIAADRSGAHTAAAVEEAGRRVQESAHADAWPHAPAPAPAPAPASASASAPRALAVEAPVDFDFDLDLDLDLAAGPVLSPLARALPFDLPSAADLDLGGDRPRPAASAVPESPEMPSFEPSALEIETGSALVEPAAGSVFDLDLDATPPTFDIDLGLGLTPPEAPPERYVRSKPSPLDLTERALLDPFEIAPTELLPLPDTVESGWDEGEVGSIDLDFDLDLPFTAPQSGSVPFRIVPAVADPVAAPSGAAGPHEIEPVSPEPLELAADRVEGLEFAPSDAVFGEAVEAPSAASGEPFATSDAPAEPSSPEPAEPAATGVELAAFEEPYAVLGDDAETPSAVAAEPLDALDALDALEVRQVRQVLVDPTAPDTTGSAMIGADGLVPDESRGAPGDAADAPYAATEEPFAASAPPAEASTTPAATDATDVTDATATVPGDALVSWVADAPGAAVADEPAASPIGASFDAGYTVLGESPVVEARAAEPTPSSSAISEPLPVDAGEPWFAVPGTAALPNPAAADATPGGVGAEAEAESPGGAEAAAAAEVEVDADADATPAPVASADEEPIRAVGPLRISAPLFTIYLSEADELSRRLVTEVGEWTGELHRPVGETPIALAHSLAGNSATVGYTELSQLARSLENALTRSRKIGSGLPEEARLFVDAAEEIRGLLHQFAAGFLRAPSAELLRRLSEHELSSTARLDAGLSDPGDTLSPPLDPSESLGTGAEPIGREVEVEVEVEAWVAGAGGPPTVDASIDGFDPLPTAMDAEGEAVAAESVDLRSKSGEPVEPVELAEPAALIEPAVPVQPVDPVVRVESLHPSDPVSSAPADPAPADPVEPLSVDAETNRAEAAGSESASAEPSGGAPETPAGRADEAALAESTRPQPQRTVDPLAEIASDTSDLSASALSTPEPRYDPLGVVAFKPLAELPVETPRAVPSQTELDTDDSVDAVDAIDAELFPIFQEEAEELLPQLASRLREWYRRPGDAAAPAACMRTLHTLKGGARLAGAMRLGEMAHRLETRIERLAAAESIESSNVEALLVRSDALAQTFEALKSGEPDPSARTGDAARGSTAAPREAPNAPPFAAPEAPPPAASEATLPVVSGATPPETSSAVLPVVAEATPGEPLQTEAVRPVQAATEPPASEPLRTTVPVTASASAKATETETTTGVQRAVDWSRFPLSPPGAAKAADKVQATRSAVRVPAPLLDRLVNQAGEVSIARSRIEAGVVQLKTSLGDLTENLERLRTQLRDIEIQGEVQMSSRLEAAKAASQTFDPLEFDRFTRFQELTRTMAEAVNDVGTVQRSLQRSVEIAEDELAAQARMTRELQDGLLRTRMVEFESLADRLYRVVRQTAKETGRSVRLDILGGGVEVDRGVLDRMTGAFEHLLRNAVGHGIEAPDVRVAAGKEATGAIVVVLTHDGNEVGVEFRDDGAGLDLGRIRAKAERIGLLQPGQATPDAELANLIFEPGFTTAEAVTEVAGRGVGMDVVRSEVQAMGGRIETATSAGRGTSFKLVLPLTTAVTQVVMLRCGDTRVAVPSALVEAVRRATPAEIDAALASGSYPFGERTLQFFWLGALLQAGARSGETDGRTRTVVIVRSAQQRIAVQVDEVLGNQEVVVKNLGPQLARLPGLAGISLLASGEVALIYNPVALATLYGDAAREAMGAIDAPVSARAGSGAASGSHASAGRDEGPLVMVVDDSLTVRRVTQRLLLREGYRVLLAKDGLDALEQLAEHLPEVVLSDIEMPRMDGFDLVRNLRSQARLRHLPVIMITSRIAQKHRDYAAELGVDHYLGKPYSEEDLLALIGRYTRDRATTF